MKYVHLIINFIKIQTMSTKSSKSVTCAINYHNNPDGIFKSGQNLNGSVIVTCTKSKRIRAVLLTISGKATTRWETGFGNDLTTYSGEETLLESKHILIGEIKGPEFELQPGVYDYSFKCFLPEQLPSSLETTIGKIRYSVTVCVDLPSKIIDDKFVAVFTILKPLDLNLEPADIKVVFFLNLMKKIINSCFISFHVNYQRLKHFAAVVVRSLDSTLMLRYQNLDMFQDKLSTFLLKSIIQLELC